MPFLFSVILKLVCAAFFPSASLRTRSPALFVTGASTSLTTGGPDSVELKEAYVTHLVITDGD